MLNPITSTARMNPLLQMRQMQSDFSRALGGLRFMPTQVEYPLINVWTNAEGAILTADVPGVEPDTLDIAVHGDTVTLRGTRQPEQLSEEDTLHRTERITGAFARSFTLPFRLDPDAVKATFRQGVLTLELPRPESERPKRIKVERA
jgi:HSP20 family protein